MTVFVEEQPHEEPIRVFLRLRPVNKFELSRRSAHCVAVVGNDEDSNAIEIHSPIEGEINFAFEEVFQEETNERVYLKAVAPLASYAMEGFSCALITYGQTGSGKTHTMMGQCEHVKTKSYRPSQEVDSPVDGDKLGMIQHLIKDVFHAMKRSPPSIEYIVRCSYVEIHAEKVLDLLNPDNRSIHFFSDERTNALRGASEACCFDESDAISLLVRGNGCRTVSSNKTYSSSRSHAAFLVKVEQKDSNTGICKMSQLQLIDMAGSELSAEEEMLASTANASISQEARMISKSLSLLNTVVETVVENQNKNDGSHKVPYEKSKLTHLLKDAFGGNYLTSVIITASRSSYNISEAIRTMKFGHHCQSVMNSVKASVEISPSDYRLLLNDSQKKQRDLARLAYDLSAECFQLKQDAMKQRLFESHYTGPLWETIEKVLSDEASFVTAESWGMGANNGEEMTLAELSNQGRKNLEFNLSEQLSEVAVLRTQIDNYVSEQKRNQQDLASLKSQLKVVKQKKQEVEHNLRTSQFREYEATVFLRQFRRFYRRLLRNKAFQGTGNTSEVIERVPGVPDLNDLIDIDSLLLEAGLIEESELHDDAATGTYRPSAQALSRSTDAANKAWREAACHGNFDALETFDQLSLRASRGSAEAGVSAGQLISNRQQVLSTPAGRLDVSREKELERDLLRATEKCIELQMSLNEQKANVDILNNRVGNNSKKKFAQESHHLKQQLDKKTHDLQAIIWKMNELHLINKTYNEKMSNREQHVTYLEENLVELQGSIRSMILEQNEAERSMRAELDSFKVLVDAMTVPLWQFGESGVTGRSMPSRVYLPVGRDLRNCEEGLGAEDLESLESVDETASEGDDGSEYRKGQDASTQTFISSCEIETTTASQPQRSLNNLSSPLLEMTRQKDVVAASKTEQMLLPINHAVCTWLGRGKNPRRSVHKFGAMVRPGVLKESPY